MRFDAVRQPKVKPVAESVDFWDDGAVEQEDYRVYRRVPVLDEHDIVDPRTKEFLGRVDGQKLRLIADNMNRKARSGKGECPLTLGHTKDDAPEKDQPPVKGLASNFDVMNHPEFGNVLVTDMRIPLSKVDELKAISPWWRRSVELWTGSWEVDPIALLAATTPERDLGILRLERSESGPIRYARVWHAGHHPQHSKPVRRERGDQMAGDMDMDTGGDTPAPDGVDQKLMATLMAVINQSDLGKWAKSQMEVRAAQPEGEPAPGEPGPEGDDLLGPEDHDGMDSDHDGMDEDQDHAIKSDKAMDYDASAGWSGGNGYADSFGAGAPESRRPYSRAGYYDYDLGDPGYDYAPPPRRRQPAAGEPARYSRGDLNARGERIKRSKLETEKIALEKRVAQLEQDKLSAEVDSDLAQLQAENVVLDRSEEHSRLVKLKKVAPAEYPKEITRMRTRYQKAPVNMPEIPPSPDGEPAATTPPGDGKGGRGEVRKYGKTAEEVAAYARANGLDFNSALEAMRGKQTR